MSQPDTLSIAGLVVDCFIGTTEQERTQSQKVIIDLMLGINAATAAKADDVADALDYAAVVTTVKSFVESKRFNLMETIAEQVAALVLAGYCTDEVSVRVKKKALPEIESATVEITRRRVSVQPVGDPQHG